LTCVDQIGNRHQMVELVFQVRCHAARISGGPRAPGQVMRRARRGGGDSGPSPDAVCCAPQHEFDMQALDSVCDLQRQPRTVLGEQQGYCKKAAYTVTTTMANLERRSDLQGRQWWALKKGVSIWVHAGGLGGCSADAERLVQATPSLRLAVVTATLPVSAGWANSTANSPRTGSKTAGPALACSSSYARNSGCTGCPQRERRGSR
jgi:hypothetical protein